MARDIAPYDSVTALRKAEVYEFLVAQLSDEANVRRMIAGTLDDDERAALRSVLAAGGALPRETVRGPLRRRRRRVPPLAGLCARLDARKAPLSWPARRDHRGWGRACRRAGGAAARADRGAGVGLDRTSPAQSPGRQVVSPDVPGTGAATCLCTREEPQPCPAPAVMQSGSPDLVPGTSAEETHRRRTSAGDVHPSASPPAAAQRNTVVPAHATCVFANCRSTSARTCATSAGASRLAR